MSKNTFVHQSLVNQIIEETFATLEKYNQFDTRTIQRLKELAKSHDLSKAQKVEDVIRSEPRERA